MQCAAVRTTCGEISVPVQMFPAVLTRTTAGSPGQGSGNPLMIGSD
jgi:hypothetical protein